MGGAENHRSRTVFDLDEEAPTDGLEGEKGPNQDECDSPGAPQGGGAACLGPEVWDRMAGDMAEIDWDEAWRRSR